MEIYSNKILLQKTDISNKQTKLTPQKLKREEQQEVSRRKGIKKKKKEKQSRNKNEENNSKDQ